MWRDFVDVVSSENLRRLNSQDPEQALDQDKVLQLLLKARDDKDMARKMQLVRATPYSCFQCVHADNNRVEI